MEIEHLFGLEAGVTLMRSDIKEMANDNNEMAMVDRGDWLVERRSVLEQGEATWLEALAVFDCEQGYRLDGHVSCVTWLVWRTGMSRGTAFEKLRIAHELSRRPVVADAFADGQVSYSAVRAITRLERPDVEVDQALVDLAIAGTVRDLERAVRHYQLCAEQDRAPDVARSERRGVVTSRSWDGLGRAEVTLDAVELEEFDAALSLFMNHQMPVDDSSRGDTDASHDDADSSNGDAGQTELELPVEPVEPVAAWKRRADALMELVRTAVAHIDGKFSVGAERYMVHVITDARSGQSEHLDGDPLRPAEAARVACDATIVAHYHDRDGQPLHLGRRTRVWSRAQRRAVTVRDGGCCRYPGCDRMICDVHHLWSWVDGGPTDIDNGLLLCTRHHTLIHEGLTATGNANGAVTFYRPDGSPVAATRPLRRFAQAER